MVEVTGACTKRLGTKRFRYEMYGCRKNYPLYTITRIYDDNITAQILNREYSRC